jgi:hypothetical protein
MLEQCGPCPVFAGFTMEFALQLRKKHGKTSVRVAEECKLVRRRYINIQYEYMNYSIKQEYNHTYTDKKYNLKNMKECDNNGLNRVGIKTQINTDKHSLQW